MIVPKPSRSAGQVDIVEAGHLQILQFLFSKGFAGQETEYLPKQGMNVCWLSVDKVFAWLGLRPYADQIRVYRDNSSILKVGLFGKALPSGVVARVGFRRLLIRAEKFGIFRQSSHG